MNRNRQREPEFYKWVLWGVFAFTIYSLQGATGNEVIGGILFVVFVFAGAAAGLWLIRWILFVGLESIERTRRINTITQESEMLDKVGQLSPPQIDLYRDITVGNTGRIEGTFEIDGVDIPNDWIYHYVVKDTKGNEMKPIRDFSEGSRNRAFAQLVTKLLIENGAAVGNSGNKPATITSWPKVAEALEWEM